MLFLFPAVSEAIGRMGVDHDRYRFCCFRSHVAIVSDFSLQDRFAKIRQFLSGGRFVSFSVYTAHRFLCFYD
jgi:hypothetical protein